MGRGTKRRVPYFTRWEPGKDDVGGMEEHAMKGAYCFLLLAAVWVPMTGCEKKPNEQNNIPTFEKNSKVQLNILTVKEKYESELMAIPGVVGVGIGDCNGKQCIVVLIQDRTAQTDREMPGTLDGYPVQIEVTGPIKALPQ
jgi:hypothetical protein